MFGDSRHSFIYIGFKKVSIGLSSDWLRVWLDPCAKLWYLGQAHFLAFLWEQHFWGGDLVDFTLLGAIGTYGIHPCRSPRVIVPLCSRCGSFPFSLCVLSMVGVWGSVSG